jgi:hypothetical protein
MTSQTRTFNGSPKDSLVICSNEAVIPLLVLAGYRAVPQPDSIEVIEAVPRAAHYIVSTCGQHQAIAEDLVGAEICGVEQVWISDLSCHTDLAEMVEQRGIKILHRVIGQSKPFIVTLDD